MKKYAGFIPVFLAVLALLGGCMNLLDPPGGGGGAGSGEKGRVEIQVEGGDRTALPSGGFDQYILRFAYAGAEGYTHGDVEWSSRGISVDLEPGEWTVYLDAYIGEEVSGQGSAAVTVSAGTVAPVTIRIGVNTDAKAQGTLKYKVSYPPAGASHAYRIEVLTVRDTAGNPVGSPVAITNGTEGSVQLDAGVYFVSVVVNDTVQQAGAARTSAAHIYGGQETYLEIEIGEEEFTALAPVTVTAGLTASPAIMMERRRVTLYGGADPLDTAILGWDGGGVTLWAPSSMTRVYVRQELEIGGITLSGHLETVPMSGAGTEVSLDDTLYTINLDGGIPSGAVTSAVPAAFEGNSVGVTVTPGDGKRLRPGSLKFNSEPIVETTDETTYTFIMPGADVTIHAEFADYGIRYVTRYGAGDWDGTSWENASNDVQKMMDELAAASLDGTAGYTGPYIVKLGAGSHRPKYEPMVPANPAVLDNYAYNDSPEDARDRAFILRPGVQLWGGYPESGGNDDTRDPAANISILSGDLDNSGSTPNMNDAYHVVLGVDIPSGSGTLLDGLTISGGNADTSSPSSIITVGGLSIRKNNGGGMYNDSSSPTLTNVTISGNTAKATGGGMYNYDSSPELSEVTISGNTAAGGGGMCNESESSPALTNVTISGNKAIGDSSIGGGMYNYASSPVLNNVTIGGNEPTDKNTARDGGGMGNWNVSTLNIIGVMKISGNEATHGGGMYNFNSSLVLNSNVTISGNEAANLGGGVYNCGSSMTMNGGFITGNTADSGGGIYNDTSSLELNSNATISGNEATGDGGGVYNFYLSVTMNGGFITGNTADSDSSGSGDGGGVYMSGSSTEDFDMTDGTISGNTANTGGGVYVAGGTFTKSSGGGIIYGDTDTTHTSSANENTATSGNGHAVYVESGAKKRNTDAGSSVSLNSDNSNNWE